MSDGIEVKMFCKLTYEQAHFQYIKQAERILDRTIPDMNPGELLSIHYRVWEVEELLEINGRMQAILELQNGGIEIHYQRENLEELQEVLDRTNKTIKEILDY